MFDSLALPGVGDMDHSIPALNDGRVGVLAGFRFEDEDGLPVNTIAGQRNIQRGAASGGMVVNQERPRRILEHEAIDPAVRIGQGARFHLT